MVNSIQELPMKRTLILRKCAICLQDQLVRKDSAGKYCRSCRARENSKSNKHKDMSNFISGRLTVTEFSHKNKSYFWTCKCDCGNIISVSGNRLRSGKTKSCGCIVSTQKNLSQTSTYRSWRAMLQRCYDDRVPHYKNYGGRGIVVCESWKDSFFNFLRDMKERPEGMTLDRIDTNGHYSINNCKWSTPKEQALNRRKSNAKINKVCS